MGHPPPICRGPMPCVRHCAREGNPMNNRRNDWLAIGMACLLQACTPSPEESQPPEDSAFRQQSQAASTMTGSLAKVRAQIPHTRLLDGRVLVAGGMEFNDIFLPQGKPYHATAELYDPKTGTWSFTGSMNQIRDLATAERLANGQVLVAGGHENNTVQTRTVHATAELFDPATGTWSYTGSMAWPRYKAVSVVLGDGRVLVAGGVNLQSTTDMLTAEVYSPATGSWTSTGALGAKVQRLALLPDGRVLGVAAGVNAQVYTPATNAWTSLGALPTGQGTEAVVALADGRVLLAGGSGGTVQKSSLFDPTTNTFTATGSMVTGRVNPGAVRLPDGTVLVSGGTSSGTGILSTVERYTPATGTWSADAPMLAIRVTHGSVVLDSGAVLMSSGSGVSSGYSNQIKSCERYVSSSCVPTSCTSQGAACGTVSDGCGGTLSCGTCGSGLTCSASNACVSDAAPPTAALTAPGTGTPLTGTVTLQAAASDDVAVTHVEFFDGTKSLGTSSTAPYSVAWDTVAAGDGNHTLVARAYDAAGNTGTSTAVTVQVLNTPSAGVAAYDSVYKAPRCTVAGAFCDSGTLLNGRGTIVGPELNAPNTLNDSCADGTNMWPSVPEAIHGLRVATLDGSPLAPGKVVTIQVSAYVGMPAPARIELYTTTDLANPAWSLIYRFAPSTNMLQTFSLKYTLPPGPIRAIRARLNSDGPAGPCGYVGGQDDQDDLIFATQP
ncbi:hypothetical protein D7X55_03710 [Corallococcus sp. AB049A]|nr:hypothetical protein D7X55_03710 [Corallococcus sp. AB049A]